MSVRCLDLTSKQSDNTKHLWFYRSINNCQQTYSVPWKQATTHSRTSQGAEGAAASPSPQVGKATIFWAHATFSGRSQQPKRDIFSVFIKRKNVINSIQQESAPKSVF